MKTTAEQFTVIAAIAADVLAAPIDSIKSVERIKGGLTNESWLVTVSDDRVVVRISNADEEALQIDRRSECLVLAEVQHAGVGAEVLRCHPKGRVLVTRYVPGTVWSHEDAQTPENIRRLAELLRRLHSLKIRRDVAETNLPAIVEHYWSTMADLGLPDPAGSWTRDEIRGIAHAMQASAGHCLCHNDIHHLNIIDTGRLWLIDWEYAGLGEPWFDLASVCCNHDYDETQRNELLRHYLDHVDREAAVRLEKACTLFDYIRCVWLAVRGATPAA
jgi:thiamine kinase